MLVIKRQSVRLFVAFAAAIIVLVIPMSSALALTQVDVGISNEGDAGRDNYRDSDLSVSQGEQIDFFFDNGFHNVRWAQDPSGGLSDSPGSPGGDALGTTFSVTLNTAGTYIYFCSIHTDAATALAASDFGAGRPAGMYGRIVVTADTTAPTWGAGSASASPISASQIDLSYPAATDDSGTVFYDIFQASGASDPGKGAATLVGDNVSGTAYSATGLTAGETYWFWITPVDGSGNAGPDLTANATTSSVAASATASNVVQFSVNPTLSLTVSPTILDLGTLSPAASGSGSSTVTVQSNDTWSMSIKSIGRDGVDDAIGDDAFFTSDTGVQIPVGRATWDVGGTPAPLTAAGDSMVSGQAATSSTALVVDFVVTLDFADPASTNYQTTVLYTVTQP